MEEKLELRLINPNESGFLQHIDWNMDEIRAKVALISSAYNNVVYTEDAMKSAKDDRAALNKFKKLIEDRRKEIKKKCMEPYDRFEAEVKDILKLIDEPIVAIDGQIKEYERVQKEEKKAKIREAYDSCIGELQEVLPFERAFDQKYLNQDCTLKKATASIQEKITRVARDLETIEGVEKKYRVYVRDAYMRTLDLSQALSEERRLRALEEKLEEERKAKEEAERKHREKEEARIAAENARKETEADAKTEEVKPEELFAEKPESTADDPSVLRAAQPEAVPDTNLHDSEKDAETATEEPKTEPESVQEDKRYQMVFYCIGTLEQLKGLMSYMKVNNIEFGRIEN